MDSICNKLTINVATCGDVELIAVISVIRNEAVPNIVLLIVRLNPFVVDKEGVEVVVELIVLDEATVSIT